MRSCKVSPPPLLPVLPLVLSVSLEGYGVAGCCLCAPTGGGGMSVLPHTWVTLLQVVVRLEQGMPSSSVL